MIKFQTFSEKFVREVSSHSFGSLPYELVGTNSLSPGAKELKSTGAIALLKKPSFCRQLLNLVKRAEKFRNEQPAVHAVTKRAKPSINKIRNVRKTLSTQRRNLGKTGSSMEEFDWNIRRHVHNAIQELSLSTEKLTEMEEHTVASLHPKTDLPRSYRRSKWEVLLKDFDYDPETLRRNAPTQWLIDSLNTELQAAFLQAKMNISDITRYRIIAAAVSASGFDTVAPLTVKEYFREKQRTRKQSARNSSSS